MKYIAGPRDEGWKVWALDSLAAPPWAASKGSCLALLHLITVIALEYRHHTDLILNKTWLGAAHQMQFSWVILGQVLGLKAASLSSPPASAGLPLGVPGSPRPAQSPTHWGYWLHSGPSRMKSQPCSSAAGNSCEILLCREQGVVGSILTSIKKWLHENKMKLLLEIFAATACGGLCLVVSSFVWTGHAKIQLRLKLLF